MKQLPVATKGDSGPLLIGYARVSTIEQRLDLQVDALKHAGVLRDHIHIEKVSAASKKRPALDLAIKDLRPGDTLIVWRLDRLARSMKELYIRLEQINEMGAGFKSLTEHFDFTTATGKLVLGFLGLMAEFERQLTIERTKAGMKAARDRGLVMGRTPKLGPAAAGEAYKMLKQHKSVAAIAKKFGVAKSTIYSRFQISYDKSGSPIVKRR